MALKKIISGSTKNAPQKESLPLRERSFSVNHPSQGNLLARGVHIIYDFALAKSNPCDNYLLVQLNKLLQMLEPCLSCLFVAVEEDLCTVRELAGKSAVACLVVQECLVSSVASL